LVAVTRPGAHLARIENRRGHPFEFYQKLGYAIVGVVPDANGWGKPDILMAKRVGERSDTAKQKRPLPGGEGLSSAILLAV
jgi:hypothetical protein